ATALDLMWCAVAERVHPTVVARHEPFNRENGMRPLGNGLRGDLRHAWRGLRRSPGFALTAIAMLGLAIGIDAGIFTVVKTVVIDPLPYHPADRLMYVAATAPGTEMPKEFQQPAELYLQYRERSRMADRVALFSSFTSSLRAGDRVERVRMAQTTWDLFETLGAHPWLGRLPTDADQERVVLLSYALWRSWFGGDPAVIGKSIEVSGAQRTVIGVMGNTFRFPLDGTLLWYPDTVTTGLTPGQFGWGMVARARPGITATALAAELTTLAREAPQRFGGPVSYSIVMARYQAVVRPLSQQILGDVSRPLWVLLGAVTIVLLIACANAANLFMVRTEGRLRELAVRRAIGAGRAELVRLQMAEALIIAAGSAIVAAALAAIVLPVFVHVAPEGIPRIGDVHLGLATVTYIAAAAVLAALVCGLGPSLRGSLVDLTYLREGGRGATRRRPWVRDALVAGQTALALALLIGAGLLLRSFVKLAHVRPGYDTRDVFTFQIAPSRPTLHDGPTWARFQMDLMDRLRALPGVTSVGLVDNVPLDEDPDPIRIRSDALAASNTTALVNVTFSAGDYFRTMGIPVLRGHPFNAAEATSSGHVVVSRAMAELVWPGEDPIGRRIEMEGDSTWFTVTGEVGDVMQDDFRTAPQPVFYLPLVGPTPESWGVTSPAYVVKTAQAEEIAPEVRRLVHEVAPEAPMYRVYTMAGLARRTMTSLRFMMMTLGVASVLALFLSAIGLYGVLSYVVARRTREIGVRMALGAEAGPVRRMVVWEGMRVVAIGVITGIVVAAAASRALSSLLFGVGAADIVTFAGMSAALLVIGMLASYLPARRASKVDPIESLRGE
ncbi:MAG: ABC transporter permease, partial [Gemmatimonadales bacterium]